MNTDTNQIALLIATVQQLSSKIDKMEANQLPRHQWLSSSEIAVAVGVTKFDKTLAISVAERLKRGED